MQFQVSSAYWTAAVTFQDAETGARAAKIRRRALSIFFIESVQERRPAATVERGGFPNAKSEERKSEKASVFHLPPRGGGRG